MNKYYYITPDGKKYLTLKRAARQWVNYDTPTIYDLQGNTILSIELIHGEGRLRAFIGDDTLDKSVLKQFVHASDIAFVKWMADQYSDYADKLRDKEFTLARRVFE